MSVSIVLTHHKNSEEITHKLGDFFTSRGFSIFLISENVPDRVSQRARLIQRADTFVAVADRNYQKNPRCLELLHYARDLRKPIFGLNVGGNSFIPFGTLGAILSGTDLGFIPLNVESDFDLVLSPILQALAALTPARPSSSSTHFRSPTPATNLNDTNINVNVLISYHPDSTHIAQIAHEALNGDIANCVMEDSTSGTSSVNTSKVIVVILSIGYEQNTYSRVIIEQAQAAGKKIIPVSKTKMWKPDDWLGLLVAGKLYFRIFDKQQAYEKKYDSSPINDFCFEVKKALEPRASVDQIEQSLIESLRKKIDDCRAKLHPHWPPELKKLPRIIRKPVKVRFEPPKAELELNHIHYQVTRMEFKPPVLRYDDDGVPLRTKFDCMISYNWDIQTMVRNVYMDLHMRNLSVWFDIWGFMEENSYQAMANAIECTKMMLVFVTEKYQKSPNCKLELMYAVQCGKPFIFIIDDARLKLEPWLEPLVKENLVFYVKTYEDVCVVENNVSRIDIIAQAIRAIGQAQPDYDIFDLSDEVVQLKELLNSAMDELAAKAGQARFKTCTRCKKTFDDNSKAGCKFHSAYYMGGQIIEGRWVCCQQQDKNSAGCRDADHIDAPRQFIQDPHYGTYTWVPA